MFLSLLVFVCCLVPSAHFVPVGDMNGAVGFLTRFGYLPPSNPGMARMTTPAALASALTEYQAFMGLPRTGTLDRETIREMSRPRCGNKDRNPASPGGFSRSRYQPGGVRWRVTDLTYKISEYSRRAGAAQVRAAVRDGFALWSSVSPLSFERGEHGDGQAFDGFGTMGENVLAHTWFPGTPLWGGDVHFDDDEDWASNGMLTQVAAHEIGHALGLGHTDVKDALMYPNYSPVERLHDNDILAIRELYPFRRV